jgi:cysteine desulfurase
MHLENRAQSSLRFSFGRFNTEPDVEQVIETLPKVIAKLRELSSTMPKASGV